MKEGDLNTKEAGIFSNPIQFGLFLLLELQIIGRELDFGFHLEIGPRKYFQP